MSKLAEAVERHTHKGDFVLSGGGRSAVYYDVRAALMEPGALAGAARWLGFGRTLYQAGARVCRPQVIAGVGTGGTALMGAMLVRYPKLRGLIVRTTYKGHGRQVQVEGEPLRDGEEHVLLVDDVLTTGGTLIQAAGLVRSHLGRPDLPLRAAVVLDRSSVAVHERLHREARVVVDALMRRREG